LGFLTLIRSPYKFRALIGITAVVILVNTVMPRQFWDRMQTIVAPTESLDSSARGRLYFWKVAVRMADARPFLGVGFNGYRTSYDAYDPSRGEFGEDRSPHSVWFGLLAETGYPGLGLFVVILILAVWSCRRVRVIAKRDSTRIDLGRYSVAIETALIVY